MTRMLAVRVTQYLVLLIATALLAYAISGATQNILLFLGYLFCGMAGAVAMLRRDRETMAVIVWGGSVLLFAFVFDSDRMLGVDYRPSAVGLAILWAVPVVVILLRFALWAINHLRSSNPDDPVPRRSGKRKDVSVGPMARANHPAYRWLIGCWLLWPIGTASIIMMDETLWTRMRYNNSLLLLMFLPPTVITIGFLIYRYWRDRKTGIDTAG